VLVWLENEVVARKKKELSIYLKTSGFQGLHTNINILKAYDEFVSKRMVS